MQFYCLHSVFSIQALLVGLLFTASFARGQQTPRTVALSSLDLTHLQQGWGQPGINLAVTGGALSIAGREFTNGVGTHARSVLWLRLDGTAVRFAAQVGVDDHTTGEAASVEFQVGADGRRLWRSGVLRRGQAPVAVDLDVRGVRQLLLLVTDAGDGVSFDHANWAEATITYTGRPPQPLVAPVEPALILTPAPGPAPRINGPTVYGCRPGNPFLYRIPTTGERPMQFTATNLPEGLQLDGTRGWITGTLPEPGTYEVRLRAANSRGSNERSLRIVCGDRLALTPPMGWNHWYAHYDRITDAMMRRAAEIVVSSGMADAGYQYISIDDCWMNAPQNADPLRVGPLRDDSGNLVPNRHFPDMKALTDHIHGLGLKAGIYTSPGPRTCGGFAGSYQHEAQDARQFAAWGFDLLKYDWCSYGQVAGVDSSLASFQKPYRLMGDLLRQQPRDMVLNLCQYGMGNVWEWGAEVGGHSWRTSGDLGFELNRIFEVALKNAEHRAFNGPGSWNDPDYLQIGYIGSAFGMGQPEPCSLTPNEQYAFMSMWCLMASPLFYSGDLERLDAFTLNVLCNPEVIAVNQDPLGQCARVVRLPEDAFAMVKDLSDGSQAVGLFNPGEFSAELTVEWSALGLNGAQQVRDLWRQKDLGRSGGAYPVTVPRRGGVLLRLRPDSASSGAGE